MISMQGRRHGIGTRFGSATAILSLVVAVSQPVVAQEMCAPRSSADPGRLNVSLEAEDFGLVAPCRAELQFYIVRNSDVRAVEGRLHPLRQRSEDADTSRFSVAFEGPTAGLYRGEASLRPWDAACVDTTVEIEITQCRDAIGGTIRCPEIRLARGEGFASVTLSGTGLNICTDR